MQNTKRKYMNLFVLASKMSITAKVSILHRLTGFLLFLSIPFILYVFHQTLTNKSFYDSFYGIMSLPIIKVIYLIIIFAFVYHMCIGVRFLLIDMHKGVEFKTAKKTAKLAIFISILLTVILGVLIW